MKIPKAKNNIDIVIHVNPYEQLRNDLFTQVLEIHQNEQNIDAIVLQALSGWCNFYDLL